MFGADFSFAYMEDVEFPFAELGDANFAFSYIVDGWFGGSELHDATFQFADLRHASFVGARQSWQGDEAIANRADFSFADVQFVEWSGHSKSEAVLKFIDRVIARCLAMTELPDGKLTELPLTEDQASRVLEDIRERCDIVDTLERHGLDYPRRKQPVRSLETDELLPDYIEQFLRAARAEACSEVHIARSLLLRAVDGIEPETATLYGPLLELLATNDCKATRTVFVEDSELREDVERRLKRWKIAASRKPSSP